MRFGSTRVPSRFSTDDTIRTRAAGLLSILSAAAVSFRLEYYRVKGIIKKKTDFFPRKPLPGDRQTRNALASQTDEIHCVFIPSRVFGDRSDDFENHLLPTRVCRHNV